MVLNHWLQLLNISREEILLKFQVFMKSQSTNDHTFFLLIRNLALLVVNTEFLRWIPPHVNEDLMSRVLVLQRDIPYWLHHFGPSARWRFSQRTYCGGLLFLTAYTDIRIRQSNHILHILAAHISSLCHHPLILLWLANSDFENILPPDLWS